LLLRRRKISSRRTIVVGSVGESDQAKKSAARQINPLTARKPQNSATLAKVIHYQYFTGETGAGHRANRGKS
jgi:hypothetical protein